MPTGGWPAGKWDFTQVVVGDNETSTKADGTDRIVKFAMGPPTTANPYLDVQYPYDDTYPTGPDVGSDHDSPATQLISFLAFTRSIDFQCYLMFQPPGKNSQYVPTEVLSWHYTADAKKTGPNWKLCIPASEQGPDPATAGPVATTVHPTWRGNIDDTANRFEALGSLEVTGLPPTITEGAGRFSNAFVKLKAPDGSDLPAPRALGIALVSSDPSRLKLNTQPEGFVVIKKGRSEVMFSYEVLDNGQPDVNTEVTIKASETEFIDSSVKIAVTGP